MGVEFELQACEPYNEFEGKRMYHGFILLYFISSILALYFTEIFLTFS